MGVVLRLFKNRNFRLMSFADAISVLGDQIGWVALLWFATVFTKNPAVVGLLGLVYGIPGVFLGAVVGSVLERLSVKLVLVFANVLLGVAFLVIVMLHDLHVLSAIALVILVLVVGCLTPFTTTTWMVMIPRLVKDEELGAANAVAEIVWNTSSLLGPAIAGILAAQFDALVAVFADGISFWVSSITVLFIRIPFEMEHNHSQHVRRKGWLLFEAWQGCKVLYRIKPVWWLTLSAFLILAAYGQLEVSLPLLTHNEFEASALVLGSLWSFYFIGSLAGSLASAFISKHAGIWMSWMFIGWGISFVPLVTVHRLWMVYIAMTIAGFSFGGFPPLARASVQRLVPKLNHGRIMGIRASLMAAGAPLGAYVSGLLGKWVSPFEVMGSAGALVILFGLFLFAIRSFRQINSCR